MSQTVDGQLEIDSERGVIYFHDAKTGSTILRICGLDGLPKNLDYLLDITRPTNVCHYWPAQKKG